jgi:putative flippase GtrA
MKFQLKSRLIRFSRYSIVGVFTNAAVYVVFLLMVQASLHPVASSAVAYCLGILVSYSFNRSWTFKSSASHDRDAPRFVFAYVVGFVFAIGCIAVCLIWLSPAIAQLVTIGLTAIVIYNTLRILGFGKGKQL